MEVKLACGADMNRVWEGATQPLTEHEAECPACQAVRTEALRADQLRDDTVAEDAQTKVVVDPLKLSSVWRSYAADLSMMTAVKWKSEKPCLPRLCVTALPTARTGDLIGFGSRCPTPH